MFRSFFEIPCITVTSIIDIHNTLRQSGRKVQTLHHYNCFSINNIMVQSTVYKLLVILFAKNRCLK